MFPHTCCSWHFLCDIYVILCLLRCSQLSVALWEALLRRYTAADAELYRKQVVKCVEMWSVLWSSWSPAKSPSELKSSSPVSRKINQQERAQGMFWISQGNMRKAEPAGRRTVRKWINFKLQLHTLAQKKLSTNNSGWSLLHCYFLNIEVESLKAAGFSSRWRSLCLKPVTCWPQEQFSICAKHKGTFLNRQLQIINHTNLCS